MPNQRTAPAQPINRRDPHVAVLEAAGVILGESGYGAFTIDAVAKRSGAGKTTIYRRWPTRTALFIELYNRESAAVPPIEDLGSVRAELIAEIARTWRFWRETACGRALRALIAEAQAEPATMTQFCDRFLPHRRAFARTILERAVARGEIDPACNLDVAVDLLFGFAIFRLITYNLSDPPHAVEQTVDLLIRGLAMAPRPAGGAATGT